MLTENQQKWIAALKSGEYKQTKGHLQHYNAYCCLGVACRVVGGTLRIALQENGGLDDPKLGESPQEKLLGDSLDYQPHVFEAIGLRTTLGCSDSDHPRFPEYEALFSKGGKYYNPEHKSFHCLVQLNDTRGLTFEQIAEILETYPELFFNQ